MPTDQPIGFTLTELMLIAEATYLNALDPNMPLSRRFQYAQVSLQLHQNILAQHPATDRWSRYMIDRVTRTCDQLRIACEAAEAK